jgi:hypothetical protein
MFDEDRYFDVFVEYAKADVEDILIKIMVTNRAPEAANLRVLPTIWFRNTWSWGNRARRPRLPKARTEATGEQQTVALTGTVQVSLRHSCRVKNTPSCLWSPRFLP